MHHFALVSHDVVNDDVYGCVWYNRDELTTLFEFDFEWVANGLALSHGAWLAGDNKFYQFNVASWDKFTITIYSATSKDVYHYTCHIYHNCYANKCVCVMMHVGGCIPWQKDSTNK